MTAARLILCKSWSGLVGFSRIYPNAVRAMRAVRNVRREAPPLELLQVTLIWPDFL